MRLKRRWVGLGLAGALAIFWLMREAASWRPVIIGVHQNADTLELSPDGKWILSKIGRRSNGTTRLVELRSGNAREVPFSPNSVRWTPDSRLGVTVRLPLPVYEPGDAVPSAFAPQPAVDLEQLDPSNWSKKVVFHSPQNYYHESFQDWRVSPDGQTVWTLTEAAWREFDARTGKQSKLKKWGLGEFWQPAQPARLSPDGQSVLAPHPRNGNAFQLWKIGDLKPQTLPLRFSRAEFAGNSHYLAGSNGILALRRLSDNAKIFNIFRGTIWKITPNERFLGIVRAKDIRWFDLKMGKWVEATRRPAQIGRSIEFSSDRHFAFTLARDGKIARWRLR